MLKVSDLHSYTLHGLTQLPLLKPVSFNCTIGTSPKYIERQVLASLALCVHLDTTPVNIKISGEQVSFLYPYQELYKSFSTPWPLLNSLELTAHLAVSLFNPLQLTTSQSDILFPLSFRLLINLSSRSLTSVLSFLPAVKPAAPLTSSLKSFADKPLTPLLVVPPPSTLPRSS